VPLNTFYEDPNKYKETEDDNTGTLFDTPKAIAMFLVFAILMVIFSTAIAMVVISLWPIVGTIINIHITSAIYAVLFISDMFRGKYEPSTLEGRIARIQLDFLNRQTT
jgi:hypothetical protein